MPCNYLEQLTAEWYEYNGYFVRKNVHVGKLPKGGFECELDVVAFHPKLNKLVHIEPTMDADGWAKREQRYKKKFEAGDRYIPEIFDGLKVPDEIKKIVLLGYGSNHNHKYLAGAEIITIWEFIANILAEFKDQDIYKKAISEQYPILRTLQFVANHKPVKQALEDSH